MMSVIEYLKELVLEMVDVDEADLSLDASFDELKLDSLAFIELQLGIAKNYGVKLEPQAFVSGEVKTLNDIARTVQALIEQRQMQMLG
jgi:acyl carrier protein